MQYCTHAPSTSNNLLEYMHTLTAVTLCIKTLCIKTSAAVQAAIPVLARDKRRGDKWEAEGKVVGGRQLGGTGRGRGQCRRAVVRTTGGLGGVEHRRGKEDTGRGGGMHCTEDIIKGTKY